MLLRDPLQIAVIGAGPIGIEAALEAARRGFEVSVYEIGRAGESVLRWGHVRLFSPFGMNSTEQGRSEVDAIPNSRLPGLDEFITGREYVDRYLIPLCRTPGLRQHIHERSRVLAVGRGRLGKSDLIGKPQRATDGFRLLIEQGSGQRVVNADMVIDCSGTYRQHRYLGAGGIPCPGETEILNKTDYELPDVIGSGRIRFAGKTTLIVGSGYSSATAAVALSELAGDDPRTRAVWVTRPRGDVPIPRIEGDSLFQRDRLAATANRRARDTAGPIRWLPGAVITKLSRTNSAGPIAVELQDVTGTRQEVAVDHVLGLVGYRPENRIYEELQIHECYATQGPMKLAAALQGETSADCLDQESHGPDVLKNPEPEFFILGAKSYGRNSQFLMRVGLNQVRDVFSIIDRRGQESA